MSSCDVLVVLVIFELNFNFHDRIYIKKAQISNFMKILSLEAESFHADSRQTDMTQLIVAFHNFVKAPKKEPLHISFQVFSKFFIMLLSDCSYFHVILCVNLFLFKYLSHRFVCTLLNAVSIILQLNQSCCLLVILPIFLLFISHTLHTLQQTHHLQIIIDAGSTAATYPSFQAIL